MKSENPVFTALFFICQALTGSRGPMQHLGMNVSEGCPMFSVTLLLKLKLKPNKAVDENSSFSYGASLAMWDHTVLPAT